MHYLYEIFTTYVPNENINFKKASKYTCINNQMVSVPLERDHQHKNSLLPKEV